VIMRIIQTIHGPIEESRLERRYGVEDWPSHLVVWVAWYQGEEIVREERTPSSKNTDDPVSTTQGDLPRADLTRTIELTDNENDLALVQRWRLADGMEVRKDVHVLIKHGVEADAIAAAIV
jgi:hypothetical protein